MRFLVNPYKNFGENIILEKYCILIIKKFLGHLKHYPPLS